MYGYYEQVAIFKLGVPYDSKDDYEIDYFRNRLQELKRILERLTGNAITDEKLRGPSPSYQQASRAAENLEPHPPRSVPGISTLDFVRLSHVLDVCRSGHDVLCLEAVIGDLPMPESVPRKTPKGDAHGSGSRLRRSRNLEDDCRWRGRRRVEEV